MTHYFDKGIMSQSSWHGLETVMEIADAEALIRHAEAIGAWPATLEAVALRTVDGLDASRAKAIVGRYADGTRKVLGVVSKGYQHLTDAQWRDLVRAAGKAGARPTGGFSLFDGRRVLATFEVPDPQNEMLTNLCLADSFDRTTSVLAGTSSIRPVCFNTIQAAMQQDGAGWGRLRHNSTLGEKVEALTDAVGRCVESGRKVRDLYEEARDTLLHKTDAEAILAALFPAGAPKDDETQAERESRVKRALKRRDEALTVMQRPENNEGPTLATVWNAATWLVDRDDRGRARRNNGVQSMLFGSQGKRVEEVRQLIEVVLRDGTTELVSAPDAATMGLDPAQIARAAGGLDAFV